MASHGAPPPVGGIGGSSPNVPPPSAFFGLSGGDANGENSATNGVSPGGVAPTMCVTGGPSTMTAAASAATATAASAATATAASATAVAASAASATASAATATASAATATAAATYQHMAQTISTINPVALFGTPVKSRSAVPEVPARPAIVPFDGSPISTLDKQWGTPACIRGSNVLMFVKVRKSCFVPGGVETVMKANARYQQQQQQRAKLGVTDSMFTVPTSGGVVMGASPEQVTSDINDLSMNSDGASVGTASTTASTNAGGDPFDFLQSTDNSPRYADSSEGTVNAAASTGTSTGKNPFSKLGKGLTKIAKTTQSHIERGVTTMAIKADNFTAARSPDRVQLGCYVQTYPGQPEICIGMTESRDVPQVPASRIGFEDQQQLPSEDVGMLFSIPIVVPDLPPDLAASTQIKLRLFIRSGATLLSKLNRAHPMGQTSATDWTVATLHSVVAGQTPGAVVPSFGRYTIPLAGPVYVSSSAAVDVLVIPDVKCPAFCGPGWTLADPWSERAYPTFLHTNSSPPPSPRLYFPPLHQSYAYHQLVRTSPKTSMPETGGGRIFIMATERTTESSVVLPLATSLSRIFQDAAAVSLRHGQDLAVSLKRRTQILSPPDTTLPPTPDTAIDGVAHCQMDICYFIKSSTAPAGAPQRIGVNARLQRPDSIFELDLFSGGTIPLYYSGGQPQLSPAKTINFYPRLVSSTVEPHRMLPHVLKGTSAAAGSTGTALYVGIVRLELKEQVSAPSGTSDISGNPFDVLGGATIAGGDGGVAQTPTYEAYVPLEPYLDASTTGNPNVVEAAVTDMSTGQPVGTLSLTIRARTFVKPTVTSVPAPAAIGGCQSNGLVSATGLDTFLEDMGVFPPLDTQVSRLNESASEAAAIASGQIADPQRQQAYRTRRQLETMGEFMSAGFLLDGVREYDTQLLTQRHGLYNAALTGSDPPPADVPPSGTKTPRPFRPSSSRKDEPLSGIGFNVHTQTLSLIGLDETTVSPTATGPVKVSPATPLASCHNVTCGAPADHFRGFGSVVLGNAGSAGSGDGTNSSTDGLPSLPSSTVVATGGLRRLEAARPVALQRAREAQMALIQAVAAVLGQQQLKLAAQQQPPDGRGRYISPDDTRITQLRRAAVNAVQSLQTLNWIVAVRRGNVFSEALGIAITAYLAAVSDAHLVATSGWADIWVRHGFLLTFEGLLSAVGKELGMIEDASVGIAMLRMVSVVLVSMPKDAAAAPPATAERFPVQDSPYLRWVSIAASGSGSKTQYLVEIGVDSGFYESRIPTPLRNGSRVRFYPLLFQMGVDIRQWGANAGMSVKNQMSNKPQQPAANNANPAPSDETNADDSALAEDEFGEDDGVADNDVLIALNFEGLRKMNAYAYAVFPASPAAGAPPGTPPVTTWEEAAFQSQQQAPVREVHPALAALGEAIRASAGKMEHGVLDEAGSACARFGGASAIFCKSGKDRTAMQVTYKQAKFLNNYLVGGLHAATTASGAPPPPTAEPLSPPTPGAPMPLAEEGTTPRIFADATLMRIHGTRLPICEKNVGQAKYAFNALQARFMPDMLKPPPDTLAGFLKGGRVFSREGAIES